MQITRSTIVPRLSQLEWIVGFQLDNSKVVTRSSDATISLHDSFAATSCNSQLSAIHSSVPAGMVSQLYAR